MDKTLGQIAYEGVIKGDGSPWDSEFGPEFLTPANWEAAAQAIRRETLLEAAQIADDLQLPVTSIGSEAAWDCGRNDGMQTLGDHFRALAEPPAMSTFGRSLAVTEQGIPIKPKDDA